MSYVQGQTFQIFSQTAVSKEMVFRESDVVGQSGSRVDSKVSIIGVDWDMSLNGNVGGTSDTVQKYAL